MCYVSDQVDRYAHEMGDYEAMIEAKEKAVRNAFELNPHKGLGALVSEEISCNDEFYSALSELSTSNDAGKIKGLINEAIGSVAGRLSAEEIFM